MTQIEHLREEMKAAELEIQERLGIKVDDQYQLKYDNGIAYLHTYFSDIPLMATMMEGQRNFWNWWQLNWHNRNLEFLKDEELSILHKEFQRICYRAHHNGNTLASKLKLTRVIYLPLLPTLKRAI